MASLVHNLCQIFLTKSPRWFAFNSGLSGVPCEHSKTFWVQSKEVVGGPCAKAVLVWGRGIEIGGFWVTLLNGLALKSEASRLSRGRELCSLLPELSFCKHFACLIWKQQTSCQVSGEGVGGSSAFCHVIKEKAQLQEQVEVDPERGCEKPETWLWSPLVRNGTHFISWSSIHVLELLLSKLTLSFSFCKSLAS